MLRQVLPLLLWTGLSAAAPPLLRASFDGSLEATGLAGKIVPEQVVGTATFQPGRFGQALLVGEGVCRVGYPNAVLWPRNGTITLWVQPVNWQPSDARMHIFAEIGSGDGAWLLLYKYYQNAMLLLRPQDEARRASYPRTPPLTWTAGEWHHLAGTWREGRLALYVDGELSDTEEETWLPEAVAGPLWLGDGGMGGDHAPVGCRTLLDEVRVYGVPLTASDIRALAAVGGIEVRSEPAARRWRVLVDAAGVPGLTPPVAVEVRPEAGGEVVVRGTVGELTDGRGEALIATDGLAPGRYRIRAVHPAVAFPEAPAAVFARPVLTLENARLRLQFDPATGGLVGLRDKALDRDCRRTGAVRPLLALRVVDYDTRSRGFATQDLRELTPSEQTLRRCEIETLEGARRLVVEHFFEPSILARYTVTVRDGDPLSRWSCEVHNGAPKYVSDALLVHQVAFPVLDDLVFGDDPARLALALPRYQGQYHRDPLRTLPPETVLHYAGSASMSWMDLHDDRGGLYFASHDPALPQTELVAGRDEQRTALHLGLRRWSLLWPDETWTGGECVVGLHDGDWHWGADRYREYFRAAFRRQPVPEWIAQADGWLGLGGPQYRFEDLPKLYDVARWLGLDYLQMWSEMTGSDVTYHVYLYPSPQMGGPEAVKAALADINARGGHVGFYHNYVTADPTLDQFLSQERYRVIPATEPRPFGWRDGWMDLAMTSPRGEFAHTGKGAGYTDGYWVACPAAKAWQDYSVGWIRRWAAEYGAATWYLDSVPPGYTGYGAKTPVCWHPNHGHARPLGAGPGLQQTLSRLRSELDQVRPFGLLTEAVTDYFYLWNTHALGTELAGWGLPPLPEMFTYTFPDFAIFSGSCNSITATSRYYDDLKPEDVRHEDALRRVHLMGLRYDLLPRYGHTAGLWPFDPAQPFAQWLRTLIGLRQRIKTDLYASDFRDTIGLGPLPAKVEAKLFWRRDGGSLTITLLDRRAQQTPFDLTVAAEPYRLTAGPVRLERFTDTLSLTATVKDRHWRVTIPPLNEQIAALVVATP